MTLNIEAINQLADRIERCKEVDIPNAQPGMGPAFSMLEVCYGCGAPACLLGHNAAMHGRASIAYHEHPEIAEDLGITVEQAEELTSPQHSYADYFTHSADPGFITKRHAVAVLRNLAKTGNVDWRITG